VKLEGFPAGRNRPKTKTKKKKGGQREKALLETQARLLPTHTILEKSGVLTRIRQGGGSVMPEVASREKKRSKRKPENRYCNP